MTDPTAVATAVGMLNAALSAFKNVRELSAGSGDLNLKEGVSDLYDKLLDLKQSLINLEEENRDLRQQLETRAELERRPPHGYYFKKGENDPLCPTCYQRDAKLVYLHFEPWSRGRTQRHYCRVCEQIYWEE